MNKDKAFRELHVRVHSKMKSLVIYRDGEFVIEDMSGNPYSSHYSKYLVPTEVRGEWMWYCVSFGDAQIKKALSKMEGK